LVTFPHRSQTTCGGGPCCPCSFTKSSSFVTTTTTPSVVRAGKDGRITGIEQAEILDMHGVHAVFRLKPASQRGRKLSVDPDPAH
jgi:hypothetical protein